MSLSKTVGALAGGVAGLAIAVLFVVGVNHGSIPAAVTVATILLGMLLGAAVGAYIGSADT